MSQLLVLYEEKKFESMLFEMADGREDIMEMTHEIKDALDEYNQTVLGIDGYLIEADLAGEMSSKQLTKLFHAASAISKGETPKKGLMARMKDKAQGVKDKVTGKMQGAADKVGGKMKDVSDNAAAAKELVQKMMAAIKKGADKLQNSEPVQQFDVKVDTVLGKWKDKLGDDHKAVKLAKALGDYGKENPKKSAFIIGVLTALTSAIGSPAFGMAAGVAMRSALNFLG